MGTGKGVSWFFSPRKKQTSLSELVCEDASPGATPSNYRHLSRTSCESCLRRALREEPVQGQASRHFLSAVCCSGSLSGRAWPRAVLSVSGMANSLLPAPEGLFAESSVTFLQIELLQAQLGLTLQRWLWTQLSLSPHLRP